MNDEKGITMSRLQVMFYPKTIALIGTTEKESAVGRSILENLLRLKDRKIFPVNPIARERGLEELRADVLTENESMLKVFRRLGFSTHWVPGGKSQAVLKMKERGTPGK
jgi:predicted CoA-binding protein